jgi:hypothetical protein
MFPKERNKGGERGRKAIGEERQRKRQKERRITGKEKT